MKPLTRDELYSLEAYAEARPAVRVEILAHKRDRQLDIGPNARLCFEDRRTVQYQIQEMLRIERIFERAAIEEELAAYNPLIPDGANLKATFMLEYEQEDERRAMLQKLRHIEHRVWLRFGAGEAVWAVADEDLDRSDDEKTSAVHFLRFELGDSVRRAASTGEPLSVGIDHGHYRHRVDPAPERLRESLLADLD